MTQEFLMTQAFMQIGVFNDPSSGEKDVDMATIVKALQIQCDRDFAPIWHQGAHLHFIPSTAKPPANLATIAILGTSDVAGALGYHDLTPAGLPLGKVFAATDRQYNQQVSVTLSHELLELIADPWINLTAQSDDGRFWAWENCDPVEADAFSYDINGVLVSDFVTPNWFGHGAGQYDFKGHVTSAFQIVAGGYMSVFDPKSGQGWQQIYGQKPAGAELYASRPKVGSRRERRFVGAANWATSTYEAEDYVVDSVDD